MRTRYPTELQSSDPKVGGSSPPGVGPFAPFFLKFYESNQPETDYSEVFGHGESNGACSNTIRRHTSPYMGYIPFPDLFHDSHLTWYILPLKTLDRPALDNLDLEIVP